jgi:sugar phosphate isomerase/epimerase
MVKYSIAEVTMPQLSFAEHLRTFAEVRADGIGIALRRDRPDPAGDLAAFRDSELAASVCVPWMNSVLPGGRNRDPADPRERTELISQALSELAPYEPACCVVGPGTFADYEPAKARELAVTGLRQVARRAGDLGLTLGIEPIHASVAADFTFVTDLPGAILLCDEIGEANVGVVFDVWNLWDTADVRKQIQAHVDRIVAVQVCDRREPTRAYYDRVLPGDGVADVGGLFSALKDAGYDRWLDLEILSRHPGTGHSFPDSLCHRDPLELGTDGLRKTRDLWGG